MTSISFLLAPWHLLASHLFSLLLMWHSQGRWWMYVWKPVDKRLLCVSLCAIIMQNPLMAWSYIEEKPSHWDACKDIWAQRGIHWEFVYCCLLGKHIDIMYFITLHKEHKLESHWIQQSSDQVPLSCSRDPFDLYSSPFSFPSPPVRLVLLSRHGRSQVHRWCDHTLHVREPACYQYSWIHGNENQAAGSMCMRKSTGRIPEELISKLSAALAETRTERFLNCFPGKLQGTSVCVSA